MFQVELCFVLGTQKLDSGTAGMCTTNKPSHSMAGADLVHFVFIQSLINPAHSGTPNFVNLLTKDH